VRNTGEVEGIGNPPTIVTPAAMGLLSTDAAVTKRSLGPRRHFF
jgi:hypothetical protein